LGVHVRVRVGVLAVQVGVRVGVVMGVLVGVLVGVSVLVSVRRWCLSRGVNSSSGGSVTASASVLTRDEASIVVVERTTLSTAGVGCRCGGCSSRRVNWCWAFNMLAVNMAVTVGVLATVAVRVLAIVAMAVVVFMLTTMATVAAVLTSIERGSPFAALVVTAT